MIIFGFRSKQVIVKLILCVYIRRIRRYFPSESLRTLVYVFIKSRLDYCTSLLYGLPKKQIAKLQHVQNAASTD